MISVTTQPWHAERLQHQSYGSETSYRRAAQWVSGCASVDDWGGSFGHLQHYLSGDATYRVIDGTHQHPATVVADLAHFTERADGIVLRHVLDMTYDWTQILANAMEAFRERLAVVTFTPDAVESHVQKLKSGWPIWSFNPDDLRALMGDALIGEELVHETHPERIYYVGRRA